MVRQQHLFMVVGQVERLDAELEFADEIGATLVPSGSYKGKTLHEIAGLGEKGWEWLAWAVKDERAWNKPGGRNAAFGEAVKAYVAKSSRGSE